MEAFYDFIKNECDNFSLVNITKQLNTRNISSYANIINQNTDKIYICGSTQNEEPKKFLHDSGGMVCR